MTFPSKITYRQGDYQITEHYQFDCDVEAVQDACESLMENPICRQYHAGKGEQRYILENALRPDSRSAKLAMLPVWFLSYRNGGRVSYAEVNGQTGKAVADLQVDGKRYLAGSLLLAAPLFFLRNLFFTITPVKILLIAVLLAFVNILISKGQMTRILARESGEDDKGLSSVKPSYKMRDVRWNWNRKEGNSSEFPISGAALEDTASSSSSL